MQAEKAGINTNEIGLPCFEQDESAFDKLMFPFQLRVFLTHGR